MNSQVQDLAKQLADRVIMNWEYGLKTSFQDKVKASELLDTIKEHEGHVRIPEKRKR